MIKRHHISLVIANCVAFICITSCTGGHSWFTYQNSNITARGLWVTCNQVSCNRIDYSPYWLDVIRVFAILACVFSLAGMFTVILALTILTNLKGFYNSIFCFVASVCMAVSLNSFVHELISESDGPQFSLGWSYIVGCVGLLANIFTGIYALMYLNVHLYCRELTSTKIARETLWIYAVFLFICTSSNM